MLNSISESIQRPMSISHIFRDEGARVGNGLWFIGRSRVNVRGDGGGKEGVVYRFR